MPRKKSQNSKKDKNLAAGIQGAGIVQEQGITKTIETNYMPYAMSVIVSRALPEIDGFKPSHRKILYTMYKMGLLNGSLTKCANIVGQTMKLNPHGDQAIYETLVRLSRGNEALLHPYIESKGNFGKAYSRDMAYAASRYTEAKLSPICAELFADIDKETVDFIPNYDNKTTEPTLLPTTFPSVLLNANIGIAVSMASNICPFNLNELCKTTINLIKDPEFDLHETLQGPDFSSGGFIIYDKEALDRIYNTGRGSFKVRCKYEYDKSSNCIDITQIPPTTTIEAIMDKTIDLVKQGKVKEISDMRDETDLSGLKITIDLKRGVDADKLMQKLYKMTPLEDSFSCNFNVLISGRPNVLGVREILNEWIAYRIECVRRRVFFDLNKKKQRLHLLKALEKILLDIDKAIDIVRHTREEKEVVANLMIGFGIDEIQAEYVAEIRLRHLNREYILNRTEEISALADEIKNLEEVLASKAKVKAIIVDELKAVVKKYSQPRKTMFIFADEIEEDYVEEIEDNPVHLVMTKQGYIKKITPQSLRMSGEQKLKEGDEIKYLTQTNNLAHLLFFTDKQQVYKARLCDFDETKASLMGDYIPAKLSFDENEKLIYTILTNDYSGNILFFFQNGKVAKIPLTSYQTKTNRKKLANAYNDKSDLVAIRFSAEESEYILTSSSKRKLLFNSAMINVKATRDTLGVAVMKFAKNHYLQDIEDFDEGAFANPHRYRAKTLPATGATLHEDDKGEQLKF